MQYCTVSKSVLHSMLLVLPFLIIRFDMNRSGAIDGNSLAEVFRSQGFQLYVCQFDLFDSQ